MIHLIDRIELRKLKSAYLFFVVVVFSLSFFALLSQKQEKVKLESHLYASITGHFNYYYSMDLFSLGHVAELLGSLDTSSSEDVNYILGQIKSVLDYKPFYISFASQGQNGLSEKVLSENLLQAIADYDVQKRLYLDKLKTALEQNPTVLSTEILTKNSMLKDMIQDVSSNVNQLDEAGELEYIEGLNEVTKLIAELLDAIN